MDRRRPSYPDYARRVGWIVLASAVFLVLIAIGFSLWRTLTFFALSVEGGQVTLVRGYVPPALLDEIRDIVRIGHVERGTIRVVKDAGDAKVVCSPEIDEATIQRLRNVLGRFPASKLRQAAISRRVDRPK